MNNNEKYTLEYAKQCDNDDPLKKYREQFYIPKLDSGEEVNYFTGHSLGLQPKLTQSYIEEELQAWRDLGVLAHFQSKHPWFHYHELLTEKTAQLVGAKNCEVINMNSLTANLHFLMATFYQPTKKRYKILLEDGVFPSDLYAVTSQIQHLNLDPTTALIKVKPQEDEYIISQEVIFNAIEEHKETLALILLPGVQFRTGQVFPIEAICEKAHRYDIKCGFDLAHATGNILLKLHDWQVDFATWCSYKYLNAGPGAIAGAFIHETYAKNKDLPRLAGWWGHNKEHRFKLGEAFDAIPSAEGWQVSNPPIFQLAALRASLDLFTEAGMQALRQKSEKLTGFLFSLLKSIPENKVKIITPNKRGCQLSLLVNMQDPTEKLCEHHIIVDYRKPNVMRIAPVPFYNTFVDVYKFVEVFKSLI